MVHKLPVYVALFQEGAVEFSFDLAAWSAHFVMATKVVGVFSIQISSTI